MAGTCVACSACSISPLRKTSATTLQQTYCSINRDHLESVTRHRTTTTTTRAFVPTVGQVAILPPQRHDKMYQIPSYPAKAGPQNGNQSRPVALYQSLHFYMCSQWCVHMRWRHFPARFSQSISFTAGGEFFYRFRTYLKLTLKFMLTIRSDVKHAEPGWSHMMAPSKTQKSPSPFF